MAKSLRIPEHSSAVLLLLPALLVVLATVAYPFYHTIRLALTDESDHFLGLDNLTRLVQTTAFLESLQFTLLFSAFVVITALLLGLALALLINSARIRAKTFWITVLIVPLMVSDIVSAVVWRIMYHPSFGILNYALSIFHIPPVIWLGDPQTAFFAVALIELWRSTPFFMLILYASLQLIPAQIYDAAVVDGAGRLRSFVDMTLPYLRPVMTVAITLQFIFVTHAFGVIVASTAGGPGRSTWTLSYFVYNYAFRAQQMHFASAGVLVLVLLTAVVASLFFRFVWVQRDEA